MSRVLVGLGSNLGDRAATLSAAIAALGSMPGVIVQATSAWHEMPSVGGPADQPPYLNAAVVLETSLDPGALLTEFQRIESALGRRRDVHWGPRSLDLDLLLFDDRVIETPRLVVPHPWLAVRRFVLAPAVEIAADWLHPVVGWTLGRLLAHLSTAANYLAIGGVPRVGKTLAAETLADASGVRLLRNPAIETDATALDPTGLLWNTEIEFLAERRRLLAAETWGPAGDWTVSDFWFGQGLAYAALRLAPDELARYRERWLKAADVVVAPKLLVWLDPPRETTLESGSLAEQNRLSWRCSLAEDRCFVYGSSNRRRSWPNLARRSTPCSEPAPPHGQPYPELPRPIMLM